MHTLRSAFLTAVLVIASTLGVGHLQAKPEVGYGTAHATILHAVDPAGQWMVMCQARRDTDGDGKVSASFDDHHGVAFGDDVEPYLMLGPGEGTQIDDYVAHDRSGHWIAVIRSKRLILIDTRSKQEWDLSKSGASADSASYVYGRHSAASFDAAGHRCHYVRKVKSRTVVVVRDLRTHVETVIDPGPGLFYRAHLDPSGHWILIHVVARTQTGMAR